jgi:hypothetical protein
MRRSKVGSLLAVLAFGSLTGSALDAQVQKLCEIGVSQDLCTAKTEFLGPLQLTKCAKTAVCETFRGHLRLQGGLAAHAPCDEVPELKGAVLTVTSTVDLRQQLPEPQRGSWSGTFTIAAPGVSASGNLFATLGVGSHRLNCLEKCGTNCEQCYRAAFSAADKAWKIHSEGILDGTFTSQQHPNCHLRWSFQGTFTAPGTASGPGGGPWGFCGAIDGVLECPCS